MVSQYLMGCGVVVSFLLGLNSAIAAVECRYSWTVFSEASCLSGCFGKNSENVRTGYKYHEPFPLSEELIPKGTIDYFLSTMLTEEDRKKQMMAESTQEWVELERNRVFLSLASGYAKKANEVYYLQRGLGYGYSLGNNKYICPIVVMSEQGHTAVLIQHRDGEGHIVRTEGYDIGDEIERDFVVKGKRVHLSLHCRDKTK